MGKWNESAVVLLSGGLDSTTLLWYIFKYMGYTPKDITALTISYGQKHDKEIYHARIVAKRAGVAFRSVDLTSVFNDIKRCSLLGHSIEELPTGTYADQLTVGIPSTYVPFRNGIFLSVAAAVAYDLGASHIFYGAHSNDGQNGYPDCSKTFAACISSAIAQGTGKQVFLSTPFIDWTKREIVRAGINLKVPFALTWSCYEGGDEPCRKCATCIERMKAFEDCGVSDPLLEGVNNEF